MQMRLFHRHHDRILRAERSTKEIQLLAAALHAQQGIHAPALSSRVSTEEVERLVQLLHSPQEHQRWHAAHAVIALGPTAIEDLLEDIAHATLGERLRDTYHYVLRHERHNRYGGLDAVARALNSPGYRTEAPLAAARALRALGTAARTTSTGKPAPGHRHLMTPHPGQDGTPGVAGAISNSAA